MAHDGRQGIAVSQQRASAKLDGYRPLEQQDDIKSYLWSLGITEDPFTMDPIKRLAFLSRTRETALVVYAAIKHATRGEYELTQSFNEWCRELGLPW